MNEAIQKALTWRYAVKVFDAQKMVDEKVFSTILESGRLAPSAFGLEPWKFFVISKKELRQELRAVSFDQAKVTDASHLIVLARRTDMKTRGWEELESRVMAQTGASSEQLAGYKAMVSGFLEGMPENALDAWARSQTYIPLGMMMETAALLGVDTCPMEGFDAQKVDEILGLSQQNLSVTAMLAVGYRGEDAYAGHPKVRRSAEEVIVKVV